MDSLASETSLRSLGGNEGQSKARGSVARAFGVRERRRPTALLLSGLFVFHHQADGLVQNGHDLLIVGDVFLRERPTLPVLQPLLADLIPADLEVPDSLGYAVKTDRSRRGGL